MAGVDLFQRHPANPILTAELLPFSANTIFNPGAATCDGETVLLNRVEDRRGISRLVVARSADGIGDWRVDTGPGLMPDPADHPEEVWGVEDPRITWLPERSEWAVAYTAYSRRGPLVSLALTSDFRTFDRIGPTMPPEDKDAALFPRPFRGRWALLHRPVPMRGGAHIWVSYSPDLQHWGELSLVLPAREGGWWDADKIGLGPPPMETSEGWLIMYHGVHVTAGGAIYRAGLALLDLDDPRIVRRRSDEWLIGPREAYEMVGDVSQAVFPTGWIVDDETDTLRVYYGAADTSVCLMTARMSEVMTYVLDCPEPPRQRVVDQS